MTFWEIVLVVRLLLLAPQFVYWFWLRDENRDDVVWDACLYPGKDTDAKPGLGPEKLYRRGSIL